MQLPFFFEENLPGTPDFDLGEDTSKHVSQVLRMEKGNELLITDGKGKILTAEILLPHKKHTSVQIVKEENFPAPPKKIAIAVSLIKNTSRFEWFVEKGTEIGITSIIPLLCKRTEKTHFRFARIKSIMVSAMLQSRQSWLPVLYEPQKFNDLINDEGYEQRFIAHCVPERKEELKNVTTSNVSSKIILIGPEGDFTEDEINAAMQKNYIPVSLGNTRLRTETAAVAAAVWLQ